MMPKNTKALGSELNDGLDPLVGKWFLASYGFSEVIGQCWANIPGRGMILRFHWGSPLRTKQFVSAGAILGQTPDPRFFARIFNILKRA